MSRYLCLGYYAPEAYDTLTDEDKKALGERCAPHDETFFATGKVVNVASLRHGSWAHIRPTPEGPVVTDGPFAEAKEVVGSYFLIEADSLEEAVEIASLHPASRIGWEMGFHGGPAHRPGVGRTRAVRGRGGRADPQGLRGHVTTTEVRRTVEAVWRMESARIVAGLVRLTGDVGDAEDFAQDALVAALEQWGESGVPDNPGAWLSTVARRKALDRIRHSDMAEQKHQQIAGDVRLTGTVAEPDAGLDETIEDEVLRLVFICCHPVLSTEARVALTLRLVGGLSTEEIARAFLVPVATLAQRIVRAKRTLREARVPFDLPPERELPERLASVLNVVYLVFNEGYTATSGRNWSRPELCRDALRLGRVLAELAPREPEVHGLVALMELQASRLAARVGADGEAVLLMDQDRSRWDRLHIGRGFDALRRAQELGGALGPYALQAAIAACHARALTADDTDWEGIAALYDALVQVAPSPVVDLNRAVAVGRAFGPRQGLEILDRIAADGALDGYHLLPAVRGDLLERLGLTEEAERAFLEAASMTENERERAVLVRRAGRTRS